MNIFKPTLTLILATSASLAGCAQQGTVPQTTGQQAASADQTVQPNRRALATGLYELAYSARQNAVFVTSTGGWGEGSQAKILRLNPQTLAVEGEIALDRKAFGVTLDDAGNRLYVGNTVDLSVTVIDIASNRVVGVVQLEEKVKGEDGKESYPRDLRELAVDPVNKRLFLQGHSKDSVLYVVNTDTLKVDKIIPGLGGPKAPGLAFDRDGQRLFVTNLQGELITINTRTLEISGRVQTEAEQPLNIAFDAASKRLFITDQGLQAIRDYQATALEGFQSKHPGNRVLVLDADTGRKLHSIPTEAGPMGILLDAPRHRLYVTNRMAGTVAVFDSRTYALLHTLPLPTHPNSFTLDAKSGAVFVTIKNGEADADDALESVARIQL